MSNKTIVIKCDDQGQYSVGEQEPMGESMAQQPGMTQQPGDMGASPDDTMQPAESLDAALDMARELFTQDPDENAEGEEAFQQGFKQSAAESGYSAMNSRGIK